MDAPGPVPRALSERRYASIYEEHLGMRLFSCNRWGPSSFRGSRREPAFRQFGPAPLAKGKVAFTLFEKGRWTATLNDRSERCRAGDLLVAWGGDSCGWRCEGKGPHAMLGFVVALQQGAVPNVLLHRQFKRRYALRAPREYVARFDRLLGALGESPSVREWAVGGALLDLLAHILKTTAPPFRPGGEQALSLAEKVRVAQAWGREHLAQKVALGEWARSVGLHPNRFARAFREECGLSPKHWLESQRLQLARQYLLSTANSIQQVADAVGYPDAFYFSRVFHKRFGVSPLQFRKAALRP
jgi:AraC-like DNA-binding protein